MVRDNFHQDWYVFNASLQKKFDDVIDEDYHVMFNLSRLRPRSWFSHHQITTVILLLLQYTIFLFCSDTNYRIKLLTYFTLLVIFAIHNKCTNNIRLNKTKLKSKFKFTIMLDQYDVSRWLIIATLYKKQFNTSLSSFNHLS